MPGGLHTLFVTFADREVPVLCAERGEVAAATARFNDAGLVTRTEPGYHGGWPPQVHVAGPQMWHDDAAITVDAAGPAALAAAATVAAHTAEGGEPAVVHATCVDGEGYRLTIRVVNPDSEAVDGAGRPVWEATYTDPVAGGFDWVRGDPDVARVLDRFDAAGLEGRTRIGDDLVAALDALRSRCRGPLLADDDPRRGEPQ